MLNNLLIISLYDRINRLLKSRFFFILLDLARKNFNRDIDSFFESLALTFHVNLVSGNMNFYFGHFVC